VVVELELEKKVGVSQLLEDGQSSVFVCAHHKEGIDSVRSWLGLPGPSFGIPKILGVSFFFKREGWGEVGSLLAYSRSLFTFGHPRSQEVKKKIHIYLSYTTYIHAYVNYIHTYIHTINNIIVYVIHHVCVCVVCVCYHKGI
jgi:hypothetical protein